MSIWLILLCALVGGLFRCAIAQGDSPPFDATIFLPGRIHSTDNIWYVDFTDEARRNRTLRISRPEIDGVAPSMWEQLNRQGGTGLWLAIDDQEAPPRNIRMINVAQSQFGVYHPAATAGGEGFSGNTQAGMDESRSWLTAAADATPAVAATTATTAATTASRCARLNRPPSAFSSPGRRRAACARWRCPGTSCRGSQAACPQPPLGRRVGRWPWTCRSVSRPWRK